MDDRLWALRLELSHIYADRKHYETAIELARTSEKAVEKLLEVKKTFDKKDPEYCVVKDLSDIREILARWYLVIGDKAKALLYYGKNFENSNQEYRYALKSLSVMAKEKPRDNEKTMKLIKSMDEPTKRKEHTRLTGCILEYKWANGFFFTTVARAAKATGDLVWLEEAYQAAVNWAKRERNPSEALILDVCLSELYFTWDRIIDFPSILMDWNICFCKILLADTYGKWLLGQALRGGDDTPETNVYMARLETLCKQAYKEFGYSDEFSTMTHCAIFIGILHRRRGRDEVAKAYFQPYVKSWIRTLFTSNSSGVYTAFYELSHVLLAAGEDEYENAAFDAIAPRRRWEDTKTNDEIGGEVKVKISAHMQPGLEVAHNSRNPAKLRWEQILALNFEEAMSVVYAWQTCEECMIQLKCGKSFERRVCNPDHAWMHIDVPEQIVERPYVLLGDEVITLHEFKVRLMKKWDVCLDTSDIVLE
ncbi:hypothetical protein AJ79_02139 [Helicocarpus griseus UAMH5409]|uniref:Uncharacterized protein n=1 Tax=Helicocarpus griseus UAMH5409 TaxID=1447875 RepID=A0A2B7Y3N5_9EURO|nr:hypothetical protein AJ79_02139 [Helicocarpus griseus UAMH5409]